MMRVNRYENLGIISACAFMLSNPHRSDTIAQFVQPSKTIQASGKITGIAKAKRMAKKRRNKRNGK